MNRAAPCDWTSGPAARWMLVGLAAMGLLGFIRPAAAADRLVLLDGTDRRAELVGIGADGRLSAAGLDEPLDLFGLRQIQRDVAPQPRDKSKIEVHLVGGGVLLAKTARFDDEFVRVEWRDGSELRLPVDAVRGTRLATEEAVGGRPVDTQQGRELFARTLAGPPEARDKVFAIIEGKVQVLAGVLHDWTDAGVEFEWDGELRPIPAERVYGLLFARVGAARDLVGQCVVALRDGSSVSGRLASLGESRLIIFPAEEVEVALPWNEVTSVLIRSDRLAFLSDLRPVDARHQPLVGLPRSHHMDRNVLGGPLVVGNRRFDKGIGVQSRSELAFETAGRFRAFAASVGIDAAANQRGDCEFVVLADGQQKLRQRVRGGQAPVDIRVDIEGARRVTLLVEPGEELDLSDYANWCDARLLK